MTSLRPGLPVFCAGENDRQPREATVLSFQPDAELVKVQFADSSTEWLPISCLQTADAFKPGDVPAAAPHLLYDAVLGLVPAAVRQRWSQLVGCVYTPPDTKPATPNVRALPEPEEPALRAEEAPLQGEPPASDSAEAANPGEPADPTSDATADKADDAAAKSVNGARRKRRQRKRGDTVDGASGDDAAAALAAPGSRTSIEPSHRTNRVASTDSSDTASSDGSSPSSRSRDPLQAAEACTDAAAAPPALNGAPARGAPAASLRSSKRKAPALKSERPSGIIVRSRVSAAAAASTAGAVSAATAATPAPRAASRAAKRVTFHTVSSRAYVRLLGGSSGVPSDGDWPLGLGWEYADEGSIPLDAFEAARAAGLAKREAELPRRTRAASTSETRQLCHRAGPRNPLFDVMPEPQRKQLLLAAASGTQDVARENLEAGTHLDALRCARAEVGCRCAPLVASKLPVKRLKSELRLRGLSDAGDKAALAQRLALATSGAPLCSTGCSCAAAGVGCHFDVCRCECGKRCANPAQGRTYSREAVRSHRAPFLSKAAAAQH